MEHFSGDVSEMSGAFQIEGGTSGVPLSGTWLGDAPLCAARAACVRCELQRAINYSV